MSGRGGRGQELPVGVVQLTGCQQPALVEGADGDGGAVGVGGEARHTGKEAVSATTPAPPYLLDRRSRQLVVGPGDGRRQQCQGQHRREALVPQVEADVLAGVLLKGTSGDGTGLSHRASGLGPDYGVSVCATVPSSPVGAGSAWCAARLGGMKADAVNTAGA